MQIAHVTSTRTNCMKRAVGAVIVNDFRVVSTGYNGTPAGTINCNQGGCQRCNANTVSGVGLDECICIHAEENAVIEGGRAKIKGGTCYVTTFPCLGCTKSLVQAGVVRIVYDRPYPMPIVFKFIEQIKTVELVQHRVNNACNNKINIHQTDLNFKNLQIKDEPRNQTKEETKADD
jgi:dCMP deaminase